MFEVLFTQAEGQSLITPARLMLMLIVILSILLVVRLFRWISSHFGKSSKPKSYQRTVASPQHMASEQPAQPASAAVQKPSVSLNATSTPAQPDQTVFSDINETSAETADATKLAAQKAVEAVRKSDATTAPTILKTNYEKTWTERTLFTESAAEQIASPSFGDQTDLNSETHPTSDGGDRIFGPVTPVLASLLPESEESKTLMKKSLVNAGYYNPHAWQNLAAIRYLGLMLPLIGFLVLLVMGPPELENLALWGLFFGPVLGWALPRFSVLNQAKARLSEIELAMPDVLDMLNMCVSQGLTLPHSLKRVSDELGGVYPAISEELAIVTHQAQLGTLDQALTNFSRRVDVPEVHSFTSLLKQTERMGTSVTEALGEYSESMRESLRQRADQKASTATFKLLFPTVLCLMPAVFLFLLGPAIIDLYDFFYGGAGDTVNEFTQTFRNSTR